MLEIGKINELKVVKEVDFGVYFDGGEYGEILMPKRYVPNNCKLDDLVNVFVYRDSEDRLIATTEMPKAMVGEFALLEATSVTTVGAFLDWGLPKDLLVPYREQRQKMEKGKKYVVYIYLDNESERIVASSKTDRFLDNLPPEYKENQEVDLFITGKTEIGYKAIINGSHTGMLYKNEVFQPLKQGQQLKGYIKKMREDEKIDLCLEKPGFEKQDTLSETILDYLKNNEGFIELTDKSDPEKIYTAFKTSKKNFKKAIGSLYKKRLIGLEENGIRLL
jgi:predicted RNA-binding protein (virulence factor B family)